MYIVFIINLGYFLEQFGSQRICAEVFRKWQGVIFDLENSGSGQMSEETLNGQFQGLKFSL